MADDHDYQAVAADEDGAVPALASDEPSRWVAACCCVAIVAAAGVAAVGAVERAPAVDTEHLSLWVASLQHKLGRSHPEVSLLLAPPANDEATSVAGLFDADEDGGDGGGGGDAGLGMAVAALELPRAPIPQRTGRSNGTAGDGPGAPPLGLHVAETPFLNASVRAFPDAMLFSPSAIDKVFGAELRHQCVLSGDARVLRVRPLRLTVPVRKGYQTYNPSVAAVHGGYVLSFRVDWQHGCFIEKKGVIHQFRDRPGERYTALQRTDEWLRPKGEPVVLDACPGTDAGGRWAATGAQGVAGARESERVMDVRLASDRATGEVWLTYLPTGDVRPGDTAHLPRECFACCFACKRSSHVARLAPGPSACGAPSATCWSPRMDAVSPLCTSEVRGRNHALLFVPGETSPRVQSWLHPRAEVVRLPPPHTPLQHAVRVSSVPTTLHFGRHANASKCPHLKFSGTTPLLPMRLGLALPPVGPRLAKLGLHREAHNGTVRGLEEAEVLVGIGHVHHAHVHKIAYFGSHYMHFFYAVQAKAPHAVIAHSGEFCLPVAEGSGRCEAVQYVSGMAMAHDGTHVIITYGVNDCDSKLAVLSVEDVAEMFRQV